MQPTCEVRLSRLVPPCGAALLLGALASPAAAQHASPPPAQRPALTAFVDHFDHIDRRRWGLSDGWTNGAHQNCTWSAEAARAENGILTLSFLLRADGNHLCGEIQSKGRALYGTFTWRARATAGSGLNAAMFTYIGPTHGQPHDEIDIEILTRNTAEVTFNTFVDGEQAGGGVAPLDPPADADWHIYEFRWLPAGVTWLVDGTEVHHAPAAPEGEARLEHPQKIFMSIWGTGTLNDWMGRFDPPGAPVVFQIDCMAHAPLAEDGTAVATTGCPAP